MNITASAGRRPKASITTAVASLTLKASNDDEATWLAALNAVLMSGGTLRIAAIGREPIDLRFTDGDEADGAGEAQK